jgi:hypothetical protein
LDRARGSLEKEKEALKVFFLFCQNRTSAADLIGTCACAQEVQFKRTLAADLVFLAICVYPSSLRDASLSQSMGTSQAGQTKFTFFSLDAYLRSRWDYQPSSSSFLTASG